MKFKFEIRDDYGWHEWFAWYPIRIHPGLWVWLEKVERRKVGSYGEDNWVYVEINDECQYEQSNDQ